MLAEIGRGGGWVGVSSIRLFPVTGNSAFRETSLLGEVAKRVQGLLPDRWAAVLSEDGANSRVDAGGDGLLSIRSPTGEVANWVVEAKTQYRVAGRYLRSLAASTPDRLLLVSPYLGPAIRARCEESDIDYLDLTGWCRLRADAPAVFVRSVGAATDPRPRRRGQIARLSGPGAGRVIRSLLDRRAPKPDEPTVTVRELAQLARVAPGTVSKVLRTLDDAGVLARSERVGRIEQVYKRHLVERWIQDYTFLKTNRVGWYLAPRGLQPVLDEVAGAGVRVAATGSYAAQRLLPRSTVPVTAMTQLALYVSDLESTAGVLELVETTPPSANVLLAEPYDVELLSTRTHTGGDLVSVGPGQIVADLLTLPGRARQEAEQLMDALAAEDQGWR